LPSRITDDSRFVLEEIESAVAVLKRRSRSATVTDLTRFNGKYSWHVERQGDVTMLWGTTGRLANGASTTLALTGNREAGGESLFRNAPLVVVSEDAVGDIGGLAAATGPEKPSASFNVQRTNNNYTVSLIWKPGNEVWEVTVLNSTGSTKDFLIQAQGV
jgi:hypothetical protein